MTKITQHTPVPNTHHNSDTVATQPKENKSHYFGSANKSDIQLNNIVTSISEEVSNMGISEGLHIAADGWSDKFLEQELEQLRRTQETSHNNNDKSQLNEMFNNLDSMVFERIKSSHSK